MTAPSPFQTALALVARSVPGPLVREARAWLKDCEWRNVDAEDIDDLPVLDVVAAVERYYEGGWAAFARATEPALAFACPYCGAVPDTWCETDSIVGKPRAPATLHAARRLLLEYPLRNGRLVITSDPCPVPACGKTLSMSVRPDPSAVAWAHQALERNRAYHMEKHARDAAEAAIARDPNAKLDAFATEATP